MKANSILALAALMAAGSIAFAQDPGPDLGGLDIEDLMKVKVTTATRREEALAKIPSAVFVLSGEEIRRSGLVGLAESLRLAPGVQVSRVNANRWAISSRGFADIFANKLLVQVDGRSVYVPLFSGVYWELQDVVVEDLDRIEVIRGPGATLWGSNAVNGVVSVVTKSARDTQGLLSVVGGGTEERLFETIRYGGRIEDGPYYRVYAKHFLKDETHEGVDGWGQGRAGFRMDWGESGSDQITVQGDFFQGTLHRTASRTQLTAPFNQSFVDRIDDAGGNLIARWRRPIGEGVVTTQVYYDHMNRDSESLGEVRDTLDLDFSHDTGPLGSHRLTWGLGFRWNDSRMKSSETVVFDDEHLTDYRANGFLQDQIDLASGLGMTLGSKFEFNSKTGFEFQPAARLAWYPDERQTVWMSAARAVRTPSNADRGIHINGFTVPGAPPMLFTFDGDEDFRSEELLALEAGYRVQPAADVSVDLSLFYNLYDDLESTESGTPFFSMAPAPHLEFPSTFTNLLSGRTWGGEAVVRWKPAAGWHVTGTASFFRMDLDFDDESTRTGDAEEEELAPSWMASLRSSWNLASDVHVDVFARYVDALTAADVPGYVEADLRAAWRPTAGLEIALVGQNLLRPHHEEMGTTSTIRNAMEIERGAYLSLTIRN